MAGLMADEDVDAVERHAGCLGDGVQHAGQMAAGALEDGERIHAEEGAVAQGVETVGYADAGAARPQLRRILAGTEGAKHGGQNGRTRRIVVRLQADRRSPVAENGRGPGLTVVEAGRGDIAGKNQGAARTTGPHHQADDVERIDEGQAGHIDIKAVNSGACQAELMLNKSRRSGNRLLHDATGADQKVDVAGLPAGLAQGLFAGAPRHPRRRFVALGDGAHIDAERLSRPAIRLAEHPVERGGRLFGAGPVAATTTDRNGNRVGHEGLGVETRRGVQTGRSYTTPDAAAISF